MTNDAVQTTTKTSEVSMTKLYVYNDPYMALDEDKMEPQVPTKIYSSSIPPTIRVAKLPIKLNTILSNPLYSDIIAWSPHGRSWKIIDSNRFLQDVIPNYFEHCNYTSFKRLVNAWGFRLITKGPDNQSYYHELFLRGLPHLHLKMRRLACREKKLPIKPGHEPDFYALAKKRPLPELKVEYDDAVKSEQTTEQASTLVPPAPSSPTPHASKGPFRLPVSTQPRHTRTVSAIGSSVMKQEIAKKCAPDNLFLSARNTGMGEMHSVGLNSMFEGFGCSLQNAQRKLAEEQVRLQYEQEKLEVRKAQVEIFQNTARLQFYQRRLGKFQDLLCAPSYPSEAMQAELQLRRQNEIIQKQHHLLCEAARLSQFQLKQVESITNSVISNHSAASNTPLTASDDKCKPQPCQFIGLPATSLSNSTIDSTREIANMMLKLSKQQKGST